MTNPYVVLLTLVVFLPALGALALAFFPKERPEGMRRFSLFITAIVFLLTVWLALPAPLDASGAKGATARFALGHAAMQDMFSIPWIGSFKIFYFMGIDGISFPLVLLTTFVSLL